MTEAKQTMLLYCDLAPNEQHKLEQFDEAIAGLLIREGITTRAIWRGVATGTGRAVRLHMGERILEITSKALQTTNLNIVLSELDTVLRASCG